MAPRAHSITTPRLELRLPTEEELLALAEVATQPVHDPSFMPFASPWSDAEPDAIKRSLVQWHWRARAAWTVDSWTLLLVAFVDGQPVGAQDVRAREYATKRVVGSGSWLTKSQQGSGLGTEMRRGLLELAFGALDAREATSSAVAENAQSLGVSKKCGYVVTDERETTVTRGVRAPGGPSSYTRPEVFVAITREQWLANRKPGYTVAGVDDDVLELMGARSSS
ncbi:MAG: putative acetyltransferase [Thermoleophilia bacterium]|nr:putative acetyltransferase [Thermoleophilia bacterium]